MTSLLTIGSSLESLQYAYQHNTKLILNRLSFPDKFEPSHIKNTWGLLYTKLMLDGKIIGGDTVKRIRITDEHVQVVCERNVINTIEYDKLYIFCDKNIIGLPDPTQAIDEYEVVDILKAVALVSRPIHKLINTKDKLVKKLYIIKETNITPIEIYSVSQLTKEELQNFEYSDTMVKFKSEHLLGENNFVGPTGNSTARRPINLEVAKRIVRKKMDRYEETERIQFIYGS